MAALTLRPRRPGSERDSSQASFKPTAPPLANLLPGLLVPAPVRAAASAQHGRSYLKRQSATNRVGTDAQGVSHTCHPSIVAEAIGRSLSRRSFGESRQRECGLF